MEKVIEKAIRKDILEGNVDRKLTTAYDTLQFLTEAEKNNLIVELMLDKMLYKIKGDV